LYYLLESSKYYRIYFNNFNKKEVLNKCEVMDLKYNSITLFRRRNCIKNLPNLPNIKNIRIESCIPKYK